MSVILEILLELAFNLISLALEIVANAWFGDLICSDTKATRIILCLLLIILAAIIFWELT